MQSVDVAARPLSDLAAWLPRVRIERLMDDALYNSPVFADERSQALYDYWIEKCGGAMAAAKNSIDPADLPDMLPQLFMLEKQTDGALRWRLFADGLTDHFGRDPTGEIFDPVQVPRHDPRYLDILGMVTSRPCGAVIRPLAHTTSHRTAILEQLCLPLLDAAGAATIVLVHTTFIDVARRDLPALGTIVELSVESFYFFNAGAGIDALAPERPRDDDQP